MVPTEHQGQQARSLTKSKVLAQSSDDNDNDVSEEAPAPVSTTESPKARPQYGISRSSHNSTASTSRITAVSSLSTSTARKAVPKSALLKGSVATPISKIKTTRARRHSSADSVNRHDGVTTLRNQLRKEREEWQKSAEHKDKAHLGELRLQEARCDGLLQDISILTAENQASEQKYQESMSRCENYANKIRALQERAHRQADSAEWMPDSASDIAHQLDRLSSDIRKWSKKHAWYARDGTQYELDAAKCMRDLQHEHDVYVDVLPAQQGRADAFERMVPLWLLLSAAVSRIAFTSLIGDPFFAFKVRDNVGALSASSAASLETIIATIKNRESITLFSSLPRASVC